MKILVLYAALLLAFAPLRAAAPPVMVDTLRCENWSAPLGVESSRPRLSWQLKGKTRGLRQSAYQVLVAGTLERLQHNHGDLWDSGRVASEQSINVPYNGQPLTSRALCYWKVRVWDERGRASAWSTPSRWAMGLLQAPDWQGQWIGLEREKAGHQAAVSLEQASLEQAKWIWFPEGDPARSAPVGTRWFRRVFTLASGQAIGAAQLGITADNSFIVWVNGREVGRGDNFHTAQRYDIGPLLKPGLNVLAVAATNSSNQPNPAGLLAAMQIEFGAAAPLRIATDATWKASAEEPAAWREATYDDAAWPAARVLADSGGGPWGKIGEKAEGSAEGSLAARYLRHEFALAGKVKRATAYVCGLGYYELHLNGRKVGDHVLDPGQTDYEQRCLYATYDATPYLRAGRNAAGLILGNGWYNQDRVWGGLAYGKPRAILQMHIELEDGSAVTVCTRPDWKGAAGPILSNNIYAGETYDARRESPGWDSANFNQTVWQAVDAMPAPGGALVSQMLPPIKAIETLRPLALASPAPGVWIFDMGQNFAGWARLNIRAAAGTRVQMKFAEAVHSNGTLDTASTGVFATGVEQIDTYVCKGAGTEIWEPRFTYHGFRYVEVTGLPQSPKLEAPRLDTLTGVVVHTAVATRGKFICGDAMLNRIHRAALWTERSNLHSVPTDCPARERCGWLGDAQVTAEMTLYNYDMTQFWAKYLDDIETTRRGGLPTDIAPGKRQGGRHADWSSAFIQIPWHLYGHSGDVGVLQRHYDGMAMTLEHFYALSKADILADGYGDWCPPGSVEPRQTPVALTSTALFYRDALIMSRTAHLLGKLDDAARYAAWGKAIRTAFGRAFYHAGAKTFGSQTADAMALELGLVPSGDETAVAQSLARDATEKHGGHHTTGIMGSRSLFAALSRWGHGEVALGILHKTDYPSIGYLFSRGATTLWECWGEAELDQKWGARSLNHPMQGGFDAWFFDGLAGINCDPNRPGFKHIVLRPQFVPGLPWVKAYVDSPHGRIRSDWKAQNGALVWNIMVPPNASATVYLPTRDAASVTESKKPAARAAGVKLLRYANGAAVYEVGSGAYHFAASR